jgi:Ca2+-binding RTX toxin-like protein
MTLPTATEITALFLYGNSSAPADKTDPSIQTHAALSPLPIDRTDFMSNGPGRFGGPAQIEIIKKFFAGNLDFLFENGVTARPLSQVSAMSNNAYAIQQRIQQLYYNDGQNDVAERAYIYNNQTFKIVGDPIFVLRVDGTREILSLATAPFDENFDFEGGSIASDVANSYLRPRIDPWSIGRAVDIEFTTGTDLIYPVYSEEQYYAEKQFIRESSHAEDGVLTAFFSSLAGSLFSSGITRFIDNEGRAIVYGNGLSGPIDLNTNTGLEAGLRASYQFIEAHAPLLSNAAGSYGIRWVGDAGVDDVKAGEHDDWLDAHGGDDILMGREGADHIDGGLGIDTASYSESDEGVDANLATGTGELGEAEGDTFYFIENLIGSDQNDVLTGNTEKNKLEGSAGADTLVGGDGVDQLFGGADADVLVSGNINGVNVAAGGVDKEVVNGGEGTDYLVVTGAAGERVIIQDGDRGDRLLVHKSILGLPGIAPGGAAIPMFALLGGVFGTTTRYDVWDENPEVFDPDANLGTDNLTGEEFRVYRYVDKTYTGKGSPINGEGEDVISITYFHFAKSHRLEIFVDNAQTGASALSVAINDFHMGDYGIRLVGPKLLSSLIFDDDSSTDDFHLDLAGSGAYNKVVTNLVSHSTEFSLTAEGSLIQARIAALAAAETPVITAANLKIAIDGDATANSLTGNNVAEIMHGAAGHDVLYGYGGNDRLYGDTGNDRLLGGAGADLLVGGEGVDSADYRSSSLGVDVSLVRGTGLFGDAQGDSLQLVENLVGSAFADVLSGDNAANRIVALAGNDVISGLAGNDTLSGGAGDDSMSGGAGADVFVFNLGFGHDTITDFWAGAGRTDRIWLQRAGVTGQSVPEWSIADTAAGAVITIAGLDSITLAGVHVAQLNLDDFIFS